MAEIEFSVLRRQETKQCGADKQALIEKVDQRQRMQNLEKAKANWQFKEGRQNTTQNYTRQLTLSSTAGLSGSTSVLN